MFNNGIDLFLPAGDVLDNAPHLFVYEQCLHSKIKKLFDPCAILTFDKNTSSLNQFVISSFNLLEL